METIATITVFTLYLLLPVVLGANSYEEFQKDGNFTCQEKNAVCKMSSGAYGCCPTKDGVCCADGDHCCPRGFKCDLSAKQCLKYEDPTVVTTKEMLRIAPLEAETIHKAPRIRCEIKAKPRNANVSNEVTCPGGEVCPTDTTCCMDLTGIYESCCPTAFGNCCSDYLSCCPSGYVCNNIDRENNCINAAG